MTGRRAVQWRAVQRSGNSSGVAASRSGTEQNGAERRTAFAELFSTCCFIIQQSERVNMISEFSLQRGIKHTAFGVDSAML